MKSKFIYLLNAMERAGQAKSPAVAGYGDKRAKVLNYVELLERDHCIVVAEYQYEPPTMSYGVKWLIDHPLPHGTKLYAARPKWRKRNEP